MARNRSPRKPYRPKPAAATTRLRAQPWRLEQAFAPLQDILEHIARGGELHATEEGAWIYVCVTQRKAYDVPATLRSYAEVFVVVRGRDSRCPDVEALREVAAEIPSGTVSDAVLQAALTCLQALRSYTATQSADLIADAAQSVTLRAHLNAIDRLGEAETAGGAGEVSAASA
ncbi:hypothetical protein [Ralstonia pseudosolanacearum]|uniref:hypothetical protein n=1 Tax=Ralstonia pseudosolanacearum TaxID=1310165 RepID=UPI003AAD361A